MAYKRIIRVEILEVMRRYFEKQNISHILEATGLDRKTVRRYIESVKQQGIIEYDREKIVGIIEEVIPRISGRPKRSHEQFHVTCPPKGNPSIKFELKKKRLKQKEIYSSASY